MKKTTTLYRRHRTVREVRNSLFGTFIVVRDERKQQQQPQHRSNNITTNEATKTTFQ